MTRHANTILRMRHTALVLLAIGMPCATVMAQQQAAPTFGLETTTDTTIALPLQVGDATRDLLVLQREGRAASHTPRPIAGEVANLSYQRYLKSFTHEIPLDFKSSVGQQSTKAK